MYLYWSNFLDLRSLQEDTLSRWTGLPSVKTRRGRRSYSILYRYHQRGAQSGGETHSYDADNFNNYLRENSIPSNCINSSYDMGSLYAPRYKCRRKTMSLSEATDDSIRTEITQFSQRTDPSSRGSSQRRYSMVVHVEKPELHPPCRTRLGKVNKFWKMFKCVRPDSPETTIKPVNCFKALSVFKTNANCNQAHVITSNGNLRISENVAANLTRTESKESSKDALSNNISNSSLKEYDRDDLCGELELNMIRPYKNEGNEEKEKDILDLP